MDAATETHATAAANDAGMPEMSETETAIQDAVVDTKVDAVVDDVAMDWSTAAWFTGCDGDLGAAFWLLSRADERRDIALLENAMLAQRAVLLQRLYARLAAELYPQGEPMKDDDGEASMTTTRWTTSAEIVDDLLETLSVETKKSSGDSFTVGYLMREVANVATELLVARVSPEDVQQLERWESHLALLWRERFPKSTVAVDLGDDRGDAAQGVGGPVQVSGNAPPEMAAHPLPPPTAKHIIPIKGSIPYVKWLVHNAIDFLQPCEKRPEAAIDNGEKATAKAAVQWTQEIQSLFEATSVSPAEEAVRAKVAAQIRDILRTQPLWRSHDVLLFGSSLSKFGSRTSDLDLCLFSPHAPSEEQSGEDTKPLEPQQSEEDQLHGTSRNDDARFLKKLLDKSLHRVESLHRTAEVLRRVTGNTGKRLGQHLFVCANWVALSVALQHYYEKLVGSEDCISVNETEGANACTLTKQDPNNAKEEAAAHNKALRQQQKQLKNELFGSAGLLSHYGCKVTAVVPRGRVPVVRFTHVESAFECDLTFNNYKAWVNTQLLRTYAECDERARMLGLAIKHWAKRRGICDSSRRFLSSYSYIMLTIFFLQNKANVLPNLQHPLLLRETNTTPAKLNGVDITFCADAAKAMTFHTAQLKKYGLQSRDRQSVGELLLSFFSFYAEKFSFSHHVVSVCHPEHAVPKKTRWHGKKLKTWRISIEDPLEPDRDLGSVLLLECQQQIIVEIKRALKLLREGHSFETVVCEPVAETKKAPKTNTHAPKSAPKPTKVVVPPAAPAPRDGTAVMADRDLWPTLGDAPKKKDERKAPGKAHGAWRGNWRSLTPARGRGRGRGLPTRDASPTKETSKET